MSTSQRSRSQGLRELVLLPALAVLTLPVHLAGCSFFDDVLDDAGFDESDSEDTEPDPPPPPSEGFRVFPRYLLQDVPATVTIEREAETEPCLLDDDPGGGYVCDATGSPAGTVTITVRRDGFDPTVRHPVLTPESIEPLVVHLSPAGGALGTWTACAPAGAFLTCGDVCSNELRTCAPTSCATEDPEQPVATVQHFPDPACAEAAVENVAASCDDPLPAELDPSTAALRCCCVDS